MVTHSNSFYETSTYLIPKPDKDRTKIKKKEKRKGNCRPVFLMNRNKISELYTAIKIQKKSVLPKKLKTGTQKHTCMPTFRAV